MKRCSFFLLAIFLPLLPSVAQQPVDEAVLRHSLEYELAQKPVLQSLPVPITPALDGWSHQGLGTIAYSTWQQEPCLLMQYPLYVEHRATGSPSDPDYAIYGSCRATLRVDHLSLQAYNRIRLRIYPECQGVQVVNSNLVINGQQAHLMNLRNHQWNTCILEFDTQQTEPVRSLTFYTDHKGPVRHAQDTCRYYLTDLAFERIEQPEKMAGWMPQPGRVIYATAGYDTQGSKTALVNASTLPRGGGRFRLCDSRGRTAFRGKVKVEETTLGTYGILDFSALRQEGEYQLLLQGFPRVNISIGRRTWDRLGDALLNYIFCQRCGYAVPGIHDVCHTDLFSHHADSSIAYSGGWHDAGDLSQQTLQTADVAIALLEHSQRVRLTSPQQADRLLREAEWGLQFVLRNRYGDGYRASSMGLLIWQDGIVGTRDDIHSVRVQNMAYDNFLYAAYEAFAAKRMQMDSPLRQQLQEAAEQDFDFAMEKFRHDGYDQFVQPYEHTYSTSASQYHATISWAASQLYSLTGRDSYAQLAVEHIAYVLRCQQTQATDGLPQTAGFFWRDTQRTSIVHSIHQCREQLYAQALVALCRTQPSHPDKGQWESSLRLMGQYIKSLMPYTSPYGMVPSGVYHAREYQDTAAFQALHLFPPQDAAQRYQQQLRQGVQLTPELYLKRFPVWFNIFNGNGAVHLAMGKTAALCGNYLGDAQLIDIAREQLYWVTGKNPFGQSLVYGVGERYPQMDSFSSGEMVGETPVGIRTWADSDEPYWPQTNNACYKEVWVTTAGKCLSLMAEL